MADETIWTAFSPGGAAFVIAERADGWTLEYESVGERVDAPSASRRVWSTDTFGPMTDDELLAILREPIRRMVKNAHGNRKSWLRMVEMGMDETLRAFDLGELEELARES